jgi:hypothetical protein
MIEGTKLKVERSNQYLQTALRETNENINGLRGQLKLLEDYKLWLSNELDIVEEENKNLEN